MSLDVCLIRNKKVSYDDGKTFSEEREGVFSANITHNLGKMAAEAGIYEALWRPHRLKPDYNAPEDDYTAEMRFENTCVTKASEIVPIVEKGLADMIARPSHYKQFDADNGWGKYKDFLPWVANYLEACKEYPNAIIEVSR